MVKANAVPVAVDSMLQAITTTVMSFASETRSTGYWRSQAEVMQAGTHA